MVQFEYQQAKWHLLGRNSSINEILVFYFRLIKNSLIKSLIWLQVEKRKEQSLSVVVLDMETKDISYNLQSSQMSKTTWGLPKKRYLFSVTFSFIFLPRNYVVIILVSNNYCQFKLKWIWHVILALIVYYWQLRYLVQCSRSSNSVM